MQFLVCNKAALFSPFIQYKQLNQDIEDVIQWTTHSGNSYTFVEIVTMKRCYNLRYPDVTLPASGLTMIRIVLSE